jgi:O-antigen/teichoic acid export membrane protein
MGGVKRFLSNSFVLVAGTILAAGLNYAYNLLVNRLLNPADYATFGALMGVVMIIGAPIGALQTIAAKYAADCYADDDEGGIWLLLKKMTARVAPIGGLLFLFFVLFSGPIANFIAQDDVSSTTKGVIVVGAGLLFQLLLPINRGLLQGAHLFADLAVNLIVDAAGRVFLGLLIMWPLATAETGASLGSVLRGEVKVHDSWAVAAAIGATVLGSFLAYMMALRPVGRWAQKPARQREFDLKKMLTFAWPTLLMYLFTTILLTVDVILVKRYAEIGTGLTPTNAGEYATLSTLAKLIFYITGPIVTVMFPMITNLVKKGEKHYRVLLIALVSVLAGSSIVLGVFSVAPNFIISKLAPNYTHVSYLLVPMTVIFLFYGLVNLFANYFLSLQKYYLLVPLAVGSILEIGLIMAYHDSVAEVIKMVTIAQMVALLGFVLYYVRMKYRSIKTWFMV